MNIKILRYNKNNFFIENINYKMNTITFKTYVGEDSIIQVSLPPNIKNTDLEITVIYQPINSSELRENKTSKGWGGNFFEEVIGGWEGEPLKREKQPDYEEREELL